MPIIEVNSDFLVLIGVVVLMLGLVSLMMWLRHRRQKKRVFFRSPSLGDLKTIQVGEDDVIGTSRVIARTEEYESVTPISSGQRHRLSDLGFSEEDPLDVPSNESVKPAKQHNMPTNLVALYVMAKPGRPFLGYELLQSLLANGLRYGVMQIFHYHAPQSDQAIFSLASATEPGFFDLEQMGGMVCQGLTLFMSLQGEADHLTNFSHMLETARALAEDLQGEVQDERHRPWTEHTQAAYERKCQRLAESVFPE